jgi:hypothetical protein
MSDLRLRVKYLKARLGAKKRAEMVDKLVARFNDPDDNYKGEHPGGRK